MRRTTKRTINVVDESRLAKRVWTLGGRVTDVVPGLGTTDALVGVHLVRLETELEAIDVYRESYSQFQWGK